MSEDKKKEIAQLIIARLDGKDIKKRFKYYESLVKKGIGGFIIFGGRLNDVTTGIRKLQGITEIPLFITSDLEQGLGQQIKGGTLFPPAMAVAHAINPHSRHDVRLLRDTISIIAKEAMAAGINVIFSPVIDVNTNPKNPIISTRAFSDNPDRVAWFGKEFIKGFQREGLIACAKHFPGHGDTVKDSHRELPVVKADMRRLERVELYPFYSAIRSGVKMIMAGHLKVPAIDPKRPASLSRKTIQGLLRAKMGFKGLVITDAMNMNAVSGKDPESEGRACLLALNAGADIILHPSNPEKVIDYLSLRYDDIEGRVDESYLKVLKAKETIKRMQDARDKIKDIGIKASWDLAYRLTQKSIKVIHKDKNPLFCHAELDSVSKKTLKRVHGDSFVVFPEQIVVLIIDDDNNKSGKPFVNALKKRYKKITTFYVDNNSPSSVLKKISDFLTSNSELIIAVFSKVSAGKGRSRLSAKLTHLLKKALKNSGHSVIAGFCYPSIFRWTKPTSEVGKGWVVNEVKADTIINAYSGSEQAQEAVAEILCASPSQL